MIKRPLCVMCLSVIMILLLMDISGLSDIWRPRKYQVLQEQAMMNETCQVEGVVHYYERKPKSIYIYLKDTILNVQSEQYSIPEIIIKYNGDKGFAIGNKISIIGGLEQPAQASNPGQFDMCKYYSARNIDFFIKAEKMSVLNEKSSRIRGTLYWLRESFCEQINKLMPENGGILSAMITGEKSFLEEEDKIRYQMSGLMHIIAISGLHFSILGMGIHKLLTKIGLNYYAAGVIALVLMLAYGILSGASASVMRAFLMFAIYIVARFVGRTYDMLSALSLAAILILLEYPKYFYDSGFQLSFGALLGIGIVLPILRRGDNKGAKKTKWQKTYNYTIEGMLSGIAIWIVTLPIQLYAYYEVSLYGILLNLFVIPTSSFVLVSGILGGSLSFCHMFLGTAFIFPARILLLSYDWLGSIAQRLPFATLILGQPKIWQCVVYYIVVIIFLVGWNSHKKEERRGWHLYLPVVLGILLTAFLGFRTYPNLQITALDVGQGDSLVIELPTGSHYLIDGGSSSDKNIGTYRIMPYLKSQGIGLLQAVVVTHPDTDHINGIIEMLEAIKEHQTSIKIKNFILPTWMAKDENAKEMRELLLDTNIPVTYVKVGDSIKDGEAVFDVMNPQKEEYDDLNEGSLTFVLRYKEFRGVFTGDLCGEAETLVTQQINVCQFLKVSHHGSKNSTPENFLEKVNPKISIISCSEKNLYGHPHEELLERLISVQSEIYSTTVGGAIVIKTKGVEKIEVSTYKRK